MNSLTGKSTAYVVSTDAPHVPDITKQLSSLRNTIEYLGEISQLLYAKCSPITVTLPEEPQDGVKSINDASTDLGCEILALRTKLDGITSSFYSLYNRIEL